MHRKENLNILKGESSNCLFSAHAIVCVPSKPKFGLIHTVLVHRLMVHFQIYCSKLPQKLEFLARRFATHIFLGFRAIKK